MLHILSPVGHHEASINKKYRDSSRHNTTTFAWMVSPYIQHINTQFSTNNFISSLYFNICYV